MLNLLLNAALQLASPSMPPVLVDGVAPNVLLIILDDIGQEDIDEVYTPSIDALAHNGIQFHRGYAMPVCAVCRYALMFGRYGESAGSICLGPDVNTPDINWPSLPRLFKSAQYNTGLFGKWHLGGNSLGRPWEQTPNLYGYDVARAVVPGNVEADICQTGFVGSYTDWMRLDDGTLSIETRYNTTVIRNQFMLWWSNTAGAKFACLSFQAAHAPFHDPPAVLVPYQPTGGLGYSGNRIRFEKMIISLDVILQQISTIVSLNNTYVFLIGDNGTPPNARSPQEPPGRYKGTVYEGGLRVPFIVAGPGIQPNTLSNSLVSVVDILPTMADLIGTQIAVPDGLSFKSILNDPIAITRNYVFASLEHDRAIVQDKYKLIRKDTVEEFYNVLIDPLEQNPIDPLTINAAIVQSLRDEMTIYLNRGF